MNFKGHFSYLIWLKAGCIQYLRYKLLVLLQIAHHTAYIHPIPSGHRFPMLKYELIPAQLLHMGIVGKEHFFTPQKATREIIGLAHDLTYVDHLLQLTLEPSMIRRIGFPMSQSLVDRELYLIDGTVQSALHALEHQVSFNTAGGTHHAGKDFGEGFCLLNDQAVAAAYLFQQQLAKKILIVDLDVHQGNGTAHIFEGHPAINTFSIHAARNFPFKKEHSTIDIALPDGIEDEAYLSLLNEALNSCISSLKPDFVFYQAGVDVLATDQLGKFKLSLTGCKARDQLVFQLCKFHQIPVQVSMGGGYSKDIKDIVNAHVNTFSAAIDIFDL